MKKRYWFLIIIVTIILLIIIPKNPKIPIQPNEKEGLFGIYTAEIINGEIKNMKQIASDSYRQINHAHVSSDGGWITFTRFNKLNEHGFAIPTGVVVSIMKTL